MKVLTSSGERGGSRLPDVLTGMMMGEGACAASGESGSESSLFDV